MTFPQRSLTKKEAGKRAHDLIQAKKVPCRFRDLQGLLSIAPSIVKLSQLGQGLDQAMTQGHGR